MNSAVEWVLSSMDSAVCTTNSPKTLIGHMQRVIPSLSVYVIDIIFIHLIKIL